MLPLIKIVEAKLSHSEADGAQWRAGGGGGGRGGERRRKKRRDQKGCQKLGKSIGNLVISGR